MSGHRLLVEIRGDDSIEEYLFVFVAGIRWGLVLFVCPKVLASAFSTEMGRLRDAGSAEAEAAAADAAAGAGSEDGLVLDVVRAEVRACFRVRLLFMEG